MKRNLNLLAVAATKEVVPAKDISVGFSYEIEGLRVFLSNVIHNSAMNVMSSFVGQRT